MQFNNLSVVEFNNIVKNIFDSEEMLFNCTVVGEISSFKISGNVAYYVIKDEFACLNCVWFSPTKIFNVGEKVKVVGRPNFFVKGGKLNFNTTMISSFGEGDIYRRFCLLKEKLSREGYFLNKKELPRVVNNIGVVTSGKGAVIKDIISVSKRRNPNVNIYVFPAKVQGDGAENEICKGINFFAQSNLVDVVIVARGGGSSEDLNAFNSELVAKACFLCNTPIISAVGHETDYTLIDLVADIRASTPSVAAEIAVNESKNYSYQLELKKQSLLKAVNQKMAILLEKLRQKSLSKTIFDAKKQSLQRNLGAKGNLFKLQLKKKLADLLMLIEKIAHQHELSSPLLYKKLGLAIIQKNGEKVTSVNNLSAGDLIDVYLAGGVVKAKIEGVKKDDD